MSATQLGNQNASKWTREKTFQYLDKIEAIAIDEFSICHTLSQALLKARCYKQLWSYWKKKWEMDEDIMDRIYYIEQIFICKLEDGALHKQLSASTCHFILKNNYGYGSKGEPEIPSYLRHEFEEIQSEKPLSGSKTKKGKEPASRASEDIYSAGHIVDIEQEGIDAGSIDHEGLSQLRKVVPQTARH